ncbi:hypothetical protein [Pelagibacterium sp. H642]|uniref:hypothetical protein n=1 Tax=Pelagibacterium sp. H642 TaxID=1881069 RepID=UPI0028165324|nr:hypothetical protein [Pelagibacterium sp. H642]WMT91941.1 hypothetical protein NO934_06690 [Pelagibacterium sp. H642]
MILDHLGLTATHLINPDDVCLYVPHRVPAHGITLVAADRSVAVVIAPMCAIEDPRLAPWLSLNGIYRVEDPSGSVARVGEGKVIDRLRRHRAAPVVLPARVVAAFAAQGEWTAQERKYLEAEFAHAWVAEGNSLASTTFDRHPYFRMAHGRRHELSLVMRRVLDLIFLGERVLDGDADFRPLSADATEWPMAPTSVPGPADEVVGPAVVMHLAREAVNFRHFEVGSRLRYADGKIAALATVRNETVVLHPGSSVYLQASASVGQRYRSAHARFLEAARVVGNSEVGFTRVAIAGRTAASLIKMVTAGRTHVASRWSIG